jgi:hypothetical protein
LFKTWPFDSSKVEIYIQQLTKFYKCGLPSIQTSEANVEIKMKKIVLSEINFWRIRIVRVDEEGTKQF